MIDALDTIYCDVCGGAYHENTEVLKYSGHRKQWLCRACSSWRRMAKALLRNDYWCKSLGQAQPKSVAYHYYRDIKAARIQREAAEAAQEDTAIKVIQDTLLFEDVVT